MFQFIENLITWIFVSSANPRNASLTVKMALLGIVPWVMQAIGIACALDTICIDLDQSALEAIATDVAQIVYYGLTIVSSVGLLYGLGRKIWRTVFGDNQALL